CTPQPSTPSLHDALPIYKFDPAPSSMEFGSEVAGSWVGLFTDGSDITLELPEGERIGEFEIPDANDSCSGEFRILDYTEEGYERSEEHTSELQSRFDLVC